MHDKHQNSGTTTIGCDRAATVSLADRAIGFVAFTLLLGLLYFGRDVLIPFTIALLLSLLLDPLVRVLRRLGLGRTLSVLIAVLTCALAIIMTTAVLAMQLLRMGTNLPHYERAIQLKLQQLDATTVDRLDEITAEVTRLTGNSAGGTIQRPPAAAEFTPAPEPVAVELRQRPAAPLQIIGRALASVWLPVETTGVVLVVMLFALLEHEALRDRFVRIAGGADIRPTTLALNDAGERLTRFFASQFTVNLGVGVTIALALALLGLPQAMLWGALAMLLRFVPYFGIWLAAALATALGLAVVPEWSLAIKILVIFFLIEFITAQAIEPRLYGHATGLSPLSVIVAALFWSSLWGPVGLILSTPLTLCLLVVGRHTKAFGFLELLLGNVQALTLAEKLYQRALCGDADEIIALARTFLKRDSFAAYCDAVLMPAVHLGFIDLEMGAITQSQQVRMRNVLVTLVSALDGEKPVRSRRPRRRSVLEKADAGHILRRQRERLIAPSPGTPAAATRPVMLCAGLSAHAADTFAAEVLIRVLRAQELDARHLRMHEPVAGQPPTEVNLAGVAIAYLVSAFPSAQRDRCGYVLDQLHALLPDAIAVTVFLPGVSTATEPYAENAHDTLNVGSFVQAVQIPLERLARAKSA
jgi:predicted PurR-regulated permease PerM